VLKLSLQLHKWIAAATLFVVVTGFVLLWIRLGRDLAGVLHRRRAR
jgi:hypothetical protein